MRIVWILLSFISIAACSRVKTETYRSKKNYDSISTKETAERVIIEYTDSGFLKAKIKTPMMVGVKKVTQPYIEMPKGIDVDFYNMAGKVESFLTAEYAISYTNKKTIVLRRKVEVLNTNGDTLNTEELIWDQNTGKIVSDKFVIIKTKTQTIWGDGMTSDQTFNDWEINNVRGTINKEQKK
jgi:LPS export ABC transporter protein LptC